MSDARILPIPYKKPLVWEEWTCGNCGLTLEMPEGHYPRDVTSLDTSTWEMVTRRRERPYCIRCLHDEMETTK